ncbi:histidine kinase N-terminal 7TM domain-containing protein [Aquibacillus albus]|uniref:Diguanylate cyclase (GGDEF)-like protein n=1 Tax=Aquibacillus albus TaxID=1168171 RepID=A0ABS2MVZ5_9BACI|nr:histidine kinase N-terminal 7TM domain-containing protein [Aquibacillus albus]MBM7570064.1 diguanylate cyclase (GGDEF)-like protein [Aquibacillus albus]
MAWGSPYLLSLFLSFVITFALFLYSVRQRTVPGAIPFGLLMLLGSIWSIGYGFEIVIVSVHEKLVFNNIKQLAIYFSPVMWLLFAWEYTGRKRMNKKNVLLLAAYPILMTALIWTNDFHHLARLDTFVVTKNGLSQIEVTSSSFFMVFMFYSFGLLLLALYFFLEAFLRLAPRFKKQPFFLMLSLLVPILSQVMDQLNLNPFEPFDLTPVTFVVCGIFIFWSIYYQKLFTISPIPRDTLIENLLDGVIVIDVTYRIIDINDYAKNLLKAHVLKKNDDLFGSDIKSILPPNSPFYDSLTFKHVLEREVVLELEGEMCYFVLKTLPLKNEYHTVTGALIILHNITEQKLLEKELKMLATIDDLTGILNRRHFLTTSSKMLKSNTDEIAVLMLDIDKFKQINDCYGHDIGDKVLQSFTAICKEIIQRHKGIFGRIGGEEFAATIPKVSLTKANEIAEAIRKGVASNNVFINDVDQISVTTSIGISIKDSNNASIEQLLKQADEALYLAKNKRNSVKHYKI